MKIELRAGWRLCDVRGVNGLRLGCPADRVNLVRPPIGLLPQRKSLAIRLRDFVPAVSDLVSGIWFGECQREAPGFGLAVTARTTPARPRRQRSNSSRQNSASRQKQPRRVGRNCSERPRRRAEQDAGKGSKCTRNTPALGPSGSDTRRVSMGMASPCREAQRRSWAAGAQPFGAGQFFSMTVLQLLDSRKDAIAVAPCPGEKLPPPLACCGRT